MKLERHDPDKSQLARPLKVPYQSASDVGIIVQGDGFWQTVVLCGLGNGDQGRIVFEELDAIRACRGEYSPYKPDPSADEEVLREQSDLDDADRYYGRVPSWDWISTIQNSAWLDERYAYEREHYEGRYSWGKDVDEMLCDFNHYVFEFRENFVEAIAKGFWIDRLHRRRDTFSLPTDHPLGDLSETSTSRSFEAHGIRLAIRINNTDASTLLDDARLCSQRLIQVGFAEDGNRWRPSRQLSLRYRDGRPISILTGPLGLPELEMDGIGNLDQVLPFLEQDLAKIKKRREEMR